MHLDPHWLADKLSILVPLWLSLTVHEWAHAYSAWLLGDDTAQKMGRMTLNPLAHIDPIGTLLLPLLGVPFGWAKPVPVNPLRFTRKIRMQTGMMLTALAGPVANVGLAVLCTVLLAAVLFLHVLSLEALQITVSILGTVILINVILATFNMLPIPPLDGSRIVDGLLPDALQPAWQSIRQLGPIALIAVLTLPMTIGFSLTRWPADAVMQMIRWLITASRG